MANTNTGKNETWRDWKVALLCTAIYFFQLGVVRTGPLFFVEYINRFNISRQTASIPFTLCRIITFLSGPFMGYLGIHFQLQTVITIGSFCSSVGLIACFWAENIIFLTLFYGIFVGFGSGTAIALLQEIINRHFDKHLSTTMGLYVAGSCVGAMVLPYITKILFDHYGLSGAFIVIGGLFLHTIPLSLALPVHPETKNSSISDNTQIVDNQKDIHSEELDADNKVIVNASHNYLEVMEENEKTANKCQVFTLNKSCYTINKSRTNVERPSFKRTLNLSAFRVFSNPIFLVLSTIMSCSLTVMLMINIIFIDYGLEKGLTSDQGVFALMILSVSNLVGRLGLGWITDCGFVDAVKFVDCGFVVIGLTHLMYIWSQGFIFWIVVSVTYGTFHGVVESYCPKLFKDYIKPNERTMAVASRRIFFVPICIASPFIFGYFKDTIKSYDGLMYALTAISFLAAVLSFVLPIMARKQSPVPSDKLEQRL